MIYINNQELGKIGEKYATKFLINLGYEIIVKNFRCRQGEIDIIARDKDEVVFVEVKSRSNLDYGNPSEAVNKFKQNHIYKVAKYFLFKFKMENYPIRFDVIELLFKNKRILINHLKQVEID